METWNGIVSLLIACIEFLLLFNLIVFIEKNRVNIIAMIMITLLASYQAMEFLMCQVGLQAPIFPYLAFVIIGFLPPLNLLLTLTLTKNLNLNTKTFLIFIPAIAFSIYYLFVIPEFAVTSCAVLYASYHYPLGDLYGAFYYLPILISIVLLIKFIPKTDDKKQKLITKVLLFGAIFISLPSTLGFILMFSGNYSILSSIESIMCKFAFVYAIILSFVCLYNSPFNDERNYFKYLFSNKQ
ncbi:MAG: hypothetical protein IPH97_07355 [Ignavibacteriales bacterium]|mgnify:CR=1 FL=1|nr:hypothetical protein [Ignavibacteriales bacterium]